MLTVIKRRLSLGYVCLNKAAVHAAAPALLVLALGALLRLVTTVYAEHIREQAGAPLASSLLALVAAGGDFVAWWAATTWALAGALSLLAAHFGAALPIETN